jgi:hypothetical protein
MRSGLLTAVALALAGVGEVQWAIAFFGLPNRLFDALMTLVAGIGLGIAAFGFYADAEGRSAAAPIGLAVAAAAHVGYVAAYAAHDQLANLGPVTLATLGAAVGLVIAAYGARRGSATLGACRAGLAVACVAGILWIVGDALHGDYAFMFGNVMAPLGWGLAALFAGRADAEA